MALGDRVLLPNSSSNVTSLIPVAVTILLVSGVSGSTIATFSSLVPLSVSSSGTSPEGSEDGSRVPSSSPLYHIGRMVPVEGSKANS